MTLNRLHPLTEKSQVHEEKTKIPSQQSTQLHTYSPIYTTKIPFTNLQPKNLATQLNPNYRNQNVG